MEKNKHNKTNAIHFLEMDSVHSVTYSDEDEDRFSSTNTHIKS